MEASFNPPRHYFRNQDNFDDKLEIQHEGIKRIASICLSECVPDCEIEEITPEKPKRKPRKAKA